MLKTHRDVHDSVDIFVQVNFQVLALGHDGPSTCVFEIFIW